MSRQDPPQRAEHIRRLFDAVVGLSPDKRAEHLNQHSADASIRSEVEALLKADDQGAPAVRDRLEKLRALPNQDATLNRAAPSDEILSRYRLEGELGAGGMGVVYRAHDRKLDRTVALKFLPPHLLLDDQAKERFVHEAKAASALDHPNICTVYDIGKTEDGRLFISMAYYPGESLKHKIAQGPVPIEDAVNYARQIAQGLSRAHEAGIIHRDVKPANIIITDRGHVKIVDFGLAKMEDVTLTQPGTTLGTPAYMSPEQIRGDAVDHRSDLWSLGVLLYEMLTGRRPFAADYPDAVRYAILNAEPESVSATQPAIPPVLASLVHRCLVKDPQERCPSAAEVIASLGQLSGYGVTDSAVVKPARSSARPTRAMTLVGAVGVLAVVVLAVVINSSNRQSESRSKDPPKRTQLTSYLGEEYAPSFSPDGNQIAFTWNGEDRSNWDIYTKQIGVGTYEPTRLTTHLGDDANPAWSPDGLYIAFLRIAGERIDVFRIPSAGGSETYLTSLLVPSRLSWSPDGQSVVFVDRDSIGSSLRVNALSIATLDRELLTSPPTDVDDLDARISPDGRLLAVARGGYVDFTSRVGQRFRMEGPGDIYVKTLALGDLKQLTFDDNHSWKMGLAWLPDGREILFTDNRDTDRLMRIKATGGAPETVSTEGDRSLNADISSDGRRLAYVEEAFVRTSFWRYPMLGIETSPPIALIQSAAHEYSAEYSPDGRRIVFNSTRSGSGEIWVCDSNGSNARQITFTGGGTPRWSPDGRYIAFDTRNAAGRGGIAVISSDGGSTRFVTPDSMRANVPFWSHDGQWIYFSSAPENADESAPSNVWKASSDGKQVLQLTTNGGQSPRESPDGQWIYYYKGGTQTIWKTPVSGGEETLVFEDFPGNAWGNWVVLTDGMYYAGPSEEGKTKINYLDFATRASTVAFVVSDFGMYMHLSPDRTHMLVQRREQGDVNIAMLEDWR